MSSLLSKIKGVLRRRAKSSGASDQHKFVGLLRFYTWASLIGVVVAAVLLTVLVRRLAIQEYIELAEKSNLVLAQSTLSQIQPELLSYLERVERIDPGPSAGGAISPPLSSAIGDLMRDGSVVRVKIYNLKGTVVFSTKRDQIGESQEGNGGFESAVIGRITSNLVYRDTLNSFDKETEDDNLISTYIPVRGSPVQPIRGVFEIYTDANGLVSRNERVQFQILFGVGLILMCLYFALLIVVRRASRLIESQQKTISERSETLAMLFSRLVSSEEQDRRKIAFELQEGLAQSLCAIKVQVEGSDRRSRGNSGEAPDAADSIVPALQGVIEQARDIAAELRPSSLDDLGLLPAINAFCRTFKQMYPEMQIDQRIALRESDTPGELKIVIYRMVEGALRNVARSAGARSVRLDLRWTDSMIFLEIDAATRDPGNAMTGDESRSELELHFAEFQERASLSGGTSSASRSASGVVTLRASWPAV